MSSRPTGAGYRTGAVAPIGLAALPPCEELPDGYPGTTGQVHRARGVGDRVATRATGVSSKSSVATIPSCSARSTSCCSTTTRWAASWTGPPANLLTAPAIPPVSEAPGETIDRYKLLEEIGEGGMGVVYLAEQQEPVRRRVALKIVKPGLDTPACVGSVRG